MKRESSLALYGRPAEPTELSLLDQIPDDARALIASSDFPYRLHPQQSLAFESPANEILFGGAKGGGKSFLLRYAFCLWAMWAPRLRLFLFRRIWDDLRQNHLEGETGFPAMLDRLISKGVCTVVSHEVRFNNGSRIFLNHMQLERHVTKYQGQAMHVIGFDEMTQFTEMQMRYLYGSSRLGGWIPPKWMEGWFPRIIGGANPGGVSHSYVKRGFIDQGPYVIVKQDSDNGNMCRQFIPARAEDNPTLLQNDPLYLERLGGMGSPELVRAMREGDWEVVSGSMFGYIWRKSRHVLERGFAIPAKWDIWRGGDDGFSSPAAVYWITQSSDTGTFYVIAELYEKGLLPEEFVDKMHARDYSIRVDTGHEVVENDAEVTGIMDSASFSDTGTGKESRGRQMNRLGAGWTPVEKAKGSRVMRVQMMHKVLAPNPRMPKDKFGVHLPGIRFIPSCLAAIETIPTLQVSRNNPEDIDDPNDHCFVAGTLIATSQGEMPVEHVARGYLVRTRLGLEPVLATWKTPTKRVITNAGLTGTPAHKIYDAEQNKWLYLSALTRLNTVCKQREWSLTELFSGVIQNPDNARLGFILSLLATIANVDGFTKRSGAQRMAIFREVATSITAMATRSTTLSKIWSALLRFNIRSGTRRNAERNCCEIFALLRRRLKRGTVPKRAGNGIGSTPSRFGTSNLNPLRARCAESDAAASNTAHSFAAQNVLPDIDGGAASTTSRKIVRCAAQNSRLTDIEEAKHAVDRVGDVYNLTVAGAPEYFANGILVSNCFDAITYGLTAKRNWFAKYKVRGI